MSEPGEISIEIEAPQVAVAWVAARGCRMGSGSPDITVAIEAAEIGEDEDRLHVGRGCARAHPRWDAPVRAGAARPCSGGRRRLTPPLTGGQPMNSRKPPTTSPNSGLSTRKSSEIP